jgi:hypothetical protein
MSNHKDSITEGNRERYQTGSGDKANIRQAKEDNSDDSYQKCNTRKHSDENGPNQELLHLYRACPGVSRSRRE